MTIAHPCLYKGVAVDLAALNPCPLFPMSRLTIARALSASGVMGATLATVASLAGIIGVVSTSPAFCPHSVGPARCNAAGSNAALIAAYGLTAAGAAGLLLVAGKITDPEA